jgi:hypothetical protein
MGRQPSLRTTVRGIIVLAIVVAIFGVVLGWMVLGTLVGIAVSGALGVDVAVVPIVATWVLTAVPVVLVVRWLVRQIGRL